MADDQTDLARAVQEVSDRASVLIREEIELAKAEISSKITKLAKGAGIGAAAGVFLLGAAYALVHAAGWFAWKALPVGNDEIWLGFVVVIFFFLLLAAVAAFIAYRLVQRGAPPMPQMAIEEAQLIRQTVSEAQSAPIERTPV
jgi:Putative Actinobacterial Holin-X, holin superfamily III